MKFLTSAILLSLSLAAAFCAEKPVFKAGIMSDTHISEKLSSFRLVKPALELFKDHKVDLVIHMGDFADVHCPEGYRLYRKIFNGIYKKNPPQELFVYDGHDAAGHKNREQAFRAMQKNLGNVNAPYAKLVLKGYTFLVYPYKSDLKRQEKEMTEAVKTSNGRPVFVLDHHPPFGTTATSRLWGSRPLRRLADKFPQVIRISGHSHGTLWNERNIWQGKFTAVNAGCLYNWTGILIGNAAENTKPDGVLIMEVYPGKILFRRFSVTNKKEIRPEKVWCIPLPFDEKTAPYSQKNRLRREKPAEFPEGSVVKINIPSKNIHTVNYTFPQAEDVRNCYIYKTELFEGKKRIARKDYHSSFYQKHPAEEVYASWSCGFLKPGKSYRFTVTPVNFAGREGKSLESIFTAPAFEQGEVRFECFDPLLPGCKVSTGTSGGKALRKHKDFFRHPGGDVRIEFPRGVWEGAKGTRFRFVIDLETRQQPDCQWTLRLRSPRPAWSANTRMWTIPGNSGIMRYVIDFEKKSTQGELYLLITESFWGQFKVHSVRIERFSGQKNNK
ncbi:MAG: metallophosphoesterase [Lentisphaeria bacterium]|nr:metallophosphoesterase [Lentisphaeria bacterium]